MTRCLQARHCLVRTPLPLRARLLRKALLQFHILRLLLLPEVHYGSDTALRRGLTLFRLMKRELKLLDAVIKVVCFLTQVGVLVVRYAYEDGAQGGMQIGVKVARDSCHVVWRHCGEVNRWLAQCSRRDARS